MRLLYDIFLVIEEKQDEEQQLEWEEDGEIYTKERCGEYALKVQSLQNYNKRFPRHFEVVEENNWFSDIFMHFDYQKELDILGE